MFISISQLNILEWLSVSSLKLMVKQLKVILLSQSLSFVLDSILRVGL